jgi:hypothetical protein
MTAMDADQNLVGDCSREQTFSVSQMARYESGINADLVLALGKLIQDAL